MNSSKAAATQCLIAPEISIIVPARNEEANLGACLDSLIAQTGVSFEIIVVDDGSTDRTREIAEDLARRFSVLRVISPDSVPPGWTGKNNAVVAGGKEARAPWLLFTDADTVHRFGSLARTLEEAQHEAADLLSYSPEQTVVTFAERAVMPVVFAELAAEYPVRETREQNSGIIAANGQYILVRRKAYNAVGGHAAVATEILEDVALARAFRNAGYRVYFRYGGDAVRTRMYRNWAQLREGWTKNLALLFPNPRYLATRSLFLWTGAWVALGIAIADASARRWLLLALVGLGFLVYRKIRVAHFSAVNNVAAIAFGIPVFAYLLMRSAKAHDQGEVAWKGRVYFVAETTHDGSHKPLTTQPIAPFGNSATEN